METEHDKTITSARKALEQARTDAVKAKEQHDSAAAAVAAAEQAFEETESDETWKRIAKAREAADRARVALKKRQRLETEAREAVTHAERAKLLAQFEQVKAAADPGAWREQSATDLAELCQLDARMVAVAERLFERAQAQVKAGYEAARLASALDVHYHQIPVGSSEVQRYIQRSLASARPANALGEHVREGDALFTPLRVLPSSESAGYAQFFQSIAQRSEGQQVQS